MPQYDELVNVLVLQFKRYVNCVYNSKYLVTSDNTIHPWLPGSQSPITICCDSIPGSQSTNTICYVSSLWNFAHNRQFLFVWFFITWLQWLCLIHIFITWLTIYNCYLFRIQYLAHHNLYFFRWSLPGWQSTITEKHCVSLACLMNSSGISGGGIELTRNLSCLHFHRGTWKLEAFCSFAAEA